MLDNELYRHLWIAEGVALLVAECETHYMHAHRVARPVGVLVRPAQLDRGHPAGAPVGRECGGAYLEAYRVLDARQTGEFSADVGVLIELDEHGRAEVVAVRSHAPVELD